MVIPCLMLNLRHSSFDAVIQHWCSVNYLKSRFHYGQALSFLPEGLAAFIDYCVSILAPGVKADVFYMNIPMVHTKQGVERVQAIYKQNQVIFKGISIREFKQLVLLKGDNFLNLIIQKREK